VRSDHLQQVLQHVLANVGRRHSALPVGDFEGHAAIAAADVLYNAEGNLFRLELDCRIVKISADELGFRLIICLALEPAKTFSSLGKKLTPLGTSGEGILEWVAKSLTTSTREMPPFCPRTHTTE